MDYFTQIFTCPCTYNDINYISRFSIYGIGDVRIETWIIFTNKSIAITIPIIIFMLLISAWIALHSIEGKRKVIDDQYAVLEIDSIDNVKFFYYKRENNIWVKDETIPANSFYGTNELFSFECISGYVTQPYYANMLPKIEWDAGVYYIVVDDRGGTPGTGSVKTWMGYSLIVDSTTTSDDYSEINYHFSEGINNKTWVSLALALILICIQVLWRTK